MAQISIFVAFLTLIIGVDQKEIKLSKHPILLVVSFDGFRYDYLTKTKTPNLSSLQKEGVKVPYLRAQFPTKTFPNHHSIATGLYPESHGVTDNTFFDPLHGRMLSRSDPEFWNYDPQVLPFWIRNEQAGDGRHSGCFLWAGSSTGYGKHGSLLPTHYVRKYDSSISWKTRVDTVISWITHDTKPANVVFLYNDEPDGHGHSYGTEDSKTLEEIRKVDTQTGVLVKMLKDAGLYDKINLIILSDHGMQTVEKRNVIHISKMADPKMYHRNGQSPIFNIQPRHSRDLELLYKAFKSASVGRNFTVFKKNELSHLNYNKSRRIMDLVLLADVGYAFEDVRFNDKGVYGVHGYDNGAESMRAFFLARGPLFKKRLELYAPIDNVDLFPLFCKIMGVPEAPNNGSLKGISNILVDSLTSPRNSRAT